MRIDTIANDLRADENDELGTGDRPGLMREGVAQLGNLIEQRDAAAIELLLLLDQACQQYGLAVRDRNRALDLALRNRRGQVGGAAGRRAAGIGDLADLLLDI